MASKAKSYGNESISALKGAETVRTRPGVMLGSDGLSGCEHAIFEIISNSIDEAREGYGNRIIITYYKDNSIEVEDFGRGCPVDYNEREGRFNWELVYCELYAGGKYHNNEGSSYEYSLGLNGLGACATQFSSRYMDVEVKRDGLKYSLHFEKGENIGGLKKEAYEGRQTGTKTKWLPDLEVFTDIKVPKEYFTDVLEKQAIVNPGIKFILKYQNADSSFESYEYLYPNGVVDYFQNIVGDSAFTDMCEWACERKGRDSADRSEYKIKMQFVFAFSAKTQLLEYYHNSSSLEYGGSPDKAVRNAFVFVIDNYIRQQSKYNKGESKITFPDVQDCLALVSNSFSTIASYEHQTKKAVTNKFIQEAMTEFLRQNLQIYFVENKAFADKIADQVLINKRSRERAEKERVNIKKKLTGTTDITNRVAKFVDCESKKAAERELYIVEGDSALGSCKQGRDARFQALMPVRGKILNCLKTSYEKIFQSEIITDLIKIMGCGVQIQSKKKELSSFNLDALRYSKIIICTDADVDGFQIRALILTMIYRLIPALIDGGYVYIAETPLYEITCKNKTYFAYDDKEKGEIIEALGDAKVSIQRSKGLGENEPEMMWQTTMCPETRRLIRVTPAEAKETEKMFDILLGDNLQGRKDYISEHGSEYIEFVDVS